MLEHDIAISTFLPRIRHRAYQPNLRFFKKQNLKLIDKFRDRIIPSVHLEILRSFGFLDPTFCLQITRFRENNISRAIDSIQSASGRSQSKFENNVREIWQINHLAVHSAQDQAYWYYVDAITHPNMPHKVLWDFGNETVVGLCQTMWNDNNFAMPILADALQDQDFPDDQYLRHLREFEHWSKANFLLQFFLSKRIRYGPEATGRRSSAQERRRRRDIAFREQDRTHVSGSLYPHQQEIIDQVQRGELRMRPLGFIQEAIDHGELVQTGENTYQNAWGNHAQEVQRIGREIGEAMRRETVIDELGRNYQADPNYPFESIQSGDRLLRPIEIATIDIDRKLMDQKREEQDDNNKPIEGSS